MNTEEYKSLINHKNVLDHTSLNVTLKELASRQEFELSDKLKKILENNKITKPDLHSKSFDTSTNYYKVDISPVEIEKIIDIFIDLEASQVGENGETTPTASFYASLADKWNNLA